MGYATKVLHTLSQTKRRRSVKNSTPYLFVYPFRGYYDLIAVKETFLVHFLLKSRNIDIEDEIKKPTFNDSHNLTLSPIKNIKYAFELMTISTKTKIENIFAKP